MNSIFSHGHPRGRPHIYKQDNHWRVLYIYPFSIKHKSRVQQCFMNDKAFDFIQFKNGGNTD